MSGRFPALRHRDFALLWGGNVVSRLGTQMCDVALAWQLYMLTHSKLALGMIGAARAIPIILLALGGGVVADAFDRRRILVVTQSTLALASTALAILTWRGAMTAPVLYAIAALSAATGAFDGPARQSIITNILPEEDLANGLSLGVMGFQISTVVGPLVGGMLLEITSIEVIYAIDAISFFAVLAALAVIRPRERTLAKTSGMGASAIIEAIRFLRDNRVLVWLMLIDFFATFFAGSLLLLPAFADEIFHAGASGYGWLVAAPSAGALAASAWLSYRPPIKRWGVVLLGAVMAYGASITAFGLVSSFKLALLLLAASGACDTVSMVIRQVARQTLTPDALRGRMTGVNMIFFVGGPQLGEVEAGIVAKIFESARVSVVSGGVLCMLAALLVGAAVPMVRRLEASARGEPDVV